MSAKPPDPPEDRLAFWQRMGREMVSGSIGVLDEVGKQLLTVEGVLVGLYFNAIAFSGLRTAATAGTLSAGAAWLYLAPVLALLVSLGAALMIFFPRAGQIDFDSAASAETAYTIRFERKMAWLRVSGITLLIAVALMAAALYIYLL